jgi:hypothetical protein
MSDSILIRMLLNEDGDIQNVLYLYVAYSLLTLLYMFQNNIGHSLVYAGVTLEIILRGIEWLSATMIRRMFYRRHPTMVAF